MDNKSIFFFFVKILFESVFASLVMKVWKLHCDVTASLNKQIEAEK
jgi:hypothetical protein